ncbi:hypothetical protein ruthe_02560 [Rubellimicrobium thermophilum DSM 16684]|uniref:DUF3137 domain-containing protein n=1 Tax=Rubellimicrobium thermophilum DSM 16684 TaxID=1123069 RepID=S9SBZ6_9RHOB|nr:hypothetical protein [Rubellimicrobium thermophilum]EPX83764.1 hypothetical protein ruthe_02560 [Rubellimicrobium thermophilum DSM 16684]
MSPLVPPGLALALLWLWLALRLARESHARTIARAAYFDAVRPLFQSAENRLQPTGFPRMTGRRGGLAFDLQAIPDTLTFRKLPALWVLVTLPEPLPLHATLDLMARPSGNEPFTRFAALPQSLPTPPELPRDVAIRTDDTTRIPPPDLIAAHADLFHDPRVKELVLSPRGLRIVILAEEADRGRYLIFREAEMGRMPLPPSRLEPLLDRLAALRQDVTAWGDPR